jgi:D-glycero-D-manno-heptose 1,7-bisphosphate phosphatase
MMKAILFDVDGTLTETLSGATFKQNPTDVKIIEGVEKGLKHFKAYKKIGISNQGGVAATHKSIEEAIEEMQYTLELLPQIEEIYICPDYEGQVCYRITKNDNLQISNLEIKEEKYSYRKPGAGMIFQAVSDHKIDLSQSWMVGDRPEDNACALNAGVEFLPAHIFHQRFLGGMQVMEGITKEQIELLEGLKI